MLTYTYRYNRVIDFFKRNPVSKETQYCELHHILPKSCKGNDDNDNLVLLPGRWHYIVHCWLPYVMLEKNDICGYKKCLNAWERMITGASYTEEKQLSYNVKKDSLLYLDLRKRANESTSKRIKEWINAHPGCRKRIWITNLETKDQRMIFPNEPIPEGYVRGRKLICKSTFISNPNTLEKRRLLDGEKIPDGWIVGDLKYSSEIWITDGKSNTRVSSEKDIPNGWRRGRTVILSEEAKRKMVEKPKNTRSTTILITNDKETKRILKTETIPEGWHKKKHPGNKSLLGKIFITNGKDKTIISKDAKIPEGWYKGTNANFVCYTNGIHTVRVNKGELPPKGFWRGQHWMTQKPTDFG